MKKYYLYTLFSACISLLLQSCATVHLDEINTVVAKNTKQILIVTTPQWTSTKGTMILYERHNNKNNWKLIDSFEVNIGRSGLAWDNKTTMQKYGTARVKHEGDGCSPAGVFSLGPLFGYHDISNVKMPYYKTDGNDICVDDMLNIYYNKFISTDTIAQDEQTWNSFENMKRTDSLYEYGVWVNYNTTPVHAGSGSCIFLHIWKNETTPTSGCTSMRKENMIELIYWLDEKKHPELVQLSRAKF